MNKIVWLLGTNQTFNLRVAGSSPARLTMSNKGCEKSQPFFLFGRAGTGGPLFPAPPSKFFPVCRQGKPTLC